MLLEFSVANFLSFKDRVTISMEAAGISEFPENAFQAERFKLLKTAVVYGANASGKSNLMRAMSTMRYLVRSSAQRSSTRGSGEFQHPAQCVRFGGKKGKGAGV